MTIDSIEEQAAELRRLAAKKRTDKGMAIVNRAMESKYEGIEGGALRVLAAWGGCEAVEIARASLERHWDGKGFGIQSAALAVIKQHATVRDLDWLSELERRAEDREFAGWLSLQLGKILSELRKSEQR